MPLKNMAILCLLQLNQGAHQEGRRASAARVHPKPRRAVLPRRL